MEVKMTRILKRRDFARWQAGERLSDAALCKAVQEMESGLIDADLGGFLYKKRVARSGGGKSGGYRTLLSARIGSRYVFLHGFPRATRRTSRRTRGRRCNSPARCSWNCPPKLCRRRCSRAFYWRCIVSKIIESLRGDLAALHEAGAIGKVTMREFDAICPPPVREFSAVDIKRLREALKFSQPVFALHLHTSASTVRKWEQGETHPTGPALKLLNVIADKGLQAII